MATDSERNLGRVIDLLRRGELYLLVGAGLSCRAGLPRWADLLNECVEEFAKLRGEDKLVSELRGMALNKDLFCFTKLREEQDGKIALREVFKRHFVEQRFDLAHKNLLDLSFRGYITINYDGCLEAACGEVKGNEDLRRGRWFCFPRHGAANIREATQGFPVEDVFSKERFIMHLHGCFHHNGRSDLTNLVLDTTQYDYVYGTEGMKEIIRELSVRPLLMVGTSFSDPYFRDMLYKMRGSIVDEINFYNAEEWFLVLPESERAMSYEAVYSKTLTVNYIYYEDKTKEGGHEDGFSRFMETLVRQARSLSVYVTEDIKVAEDVCLR